MAKIISSASRCLIWLVRGYQYLISPLKGQSCRFYPSCSSYTIDAINHHGLKGCAFAVRRIVRCHPWHPGGYDPVPERKHHAK